MNAFTKRLTVAVSLATTLATPVLALPKPGGASKPPSTNRTVAAPAPSTTLASGDKSLPKNRKTDGGFMGRPKGSAGTNMSDQQKANLQNLQNDLLGIKADSQVTPEQKDALAYSLLAMADGATKPDIATVDKLASDLSEAMADGALSNRERVMLANDVASVMNSANIPQSEVDQAIAAAQNILATSGIGKADAQMIVSDLKAIAAEGQKNAAVVKTKAEAATPVTGNVGKPRSKPGG